MANGWRVRHRSRPMVTRSWPAPAMARSLRSPASTEAAPPWKAWESDRSSSRTVGPFGVASTLTGGLRHSYIGFGPTGTTRPDGRVELAARTHTSRAGSFKTTTLRRGGHAGPVSDLARPGDRVRLDRQPDPAERTFRYELAVEQILAGTPLCSADVPGRYAGPAPQCLMDPTEEASPPDLQRPRHHRPRRNSRSPAASAAWSGAP